MPYGSSHVTSFTEHSYIVLYIYSGSTMPWGWFKWPEYLKKKACRYLLQHYLGNYLETKISLEDLTINLYNGTATVSNVPLSAEVTMYF